MPHSINSSNVMGAINIKNSFSRLVGWLGRLMNYITHLYNNTYVESIIMTD